jgi:hypothetical protein
LEKECRALAGLIAPYAAAGSGKTAFESAVQQLIDKINERYQAAAAYLGESR